MNIFKSFSKKSSQSKTIDEIKKLYEMDYEANQSSLKEYEEAKKYYHGDQLPYDVKELIEQRGQIPVIENIYKMIVDKILGYKSESIQEVKLSGRQAQDKPLATLLNDLLKVFSQQDNFDSQITKRDKDLIFGMAVVKLWVEKDKFGDIHISFENIPADSFIVDKYSREKDASDARRMHRVINLSADDAFLQFNKNVSFSQKEQYDDRVCVIETWIKESYIDENKQKQSGFSRYIWNDIDGILSYEPVPFKTKEHPFVVARYQIDHKLKWYGLFRGIKPMQDYINLAENRMLNMMSSMKIFYEEGAVLDPVKFVNEASADNAIVAVNEGALTNKKLEFVQNQAQISALSSKINEKLNLAKILSGLNDEALGFGGARQSGIAIQQRQEIGLMGLGEYLQTSDEMDKAIFKKALFLMMHYFTKKQVFKIVDKKTGERYFAINDENNENSKIKIGAFDLIYKTQLKQFGRQERFMHWSEILKSIAGIRQDIIPALLPIMLKDTESPVVEDIEEALAKADENAAQNAKEQSEIQRLQFELQIAQIKADIAETNAKAQKYTQQANVAKSIAQANKAQSTTENLVEIFTDTNATIKNSKMQNTNARDKTRTGRLKGMDLR